MKSIFLVLIFVIDIFAIELRPIPKDIKINMKIAKLGKKLFFDKNLSLDGTLSCNSCHNLSDNGASKTKYTKGVNGTYGKFNVPTVYNSIYNFRQFWDGRAKDLIDQAIQPITNPIEMGNTIKNVLKYLKNSKKYMELFSIAFNDKITKKNIAISIAEFEKYLITPNSAFDKYLRGDKSALNINTIRGYKLFQEKGCISCHNGMNIGGNLYNKLGIYNQINSVELGRYNITHKDKDKYVFKVPSLRNVALTAPYMHDGRAKTLKDAINIMSKYQLGDILDNKEINYIIAFLKSLSGEMNRYKNVSN